MIKGLFHLGFSPNHSQTAIKNVTFQLAQTKKKAYLGKSFQAVGIHFMRTAWLEQINLLSVKSKSSQVCNDLSKLIKTTSDAIASNNESTATSQLDRALQNGAAPIVLKTDQDQKNLII